jgi:hypothetical protein
VNIFRIGDPEHLLQEVLGYLDRRGRPGDGLTFSLLADSEELQQVGVFSGAAPNPDCGDGG